MAPARFVQGRSYQHTKQLIYNKINPSEVLKGGKIHVYLIFFSFLCNSI